MGFNSGLKGLNLCVYWYNGSALCSVACRMQFGYSGGHLITHACVSIRLAVWSGLLYAWSVFTTNTHRRIKCRNAPFVGFPDAFVLVNNIATPTRATVPASRHVWWVRNRQTDFHENWYRAILRKIAISFQF